MLMKPVSTAHSLLWHVAIAAVIFLIPSLILYGRSPWELSGENAGFVVGLALTYFVFGIVVTLYTKMSGPLRPLTVVIIGVAAFGAYAIFLLLTKSYQDRILFLIALAIAGASLTLSFVISASMQRVVIVVVAFAALMVPMLGDKVQLLLLGKSDRGVMPTITSRIADSAYHSINITFFDNFFDKCDQTDGRCEAPRAGGAITEFDHGYLATLGDGLIYSLSHDAPRTSLLRKELPYRAPLNSDEFIRDLGPSSLSRFRVTGAVVQKKGNDSFRLFLAHSYWKRTERCFVSRISSTQGKYGEFLAGSAKLEWTTVYETKPCLKYTGGTFYGDESGGRVVLLDDRTLILSVGDLSMDGLTGGTPLAQDMSGMYGKTVRIDIETGKGTIISMGHRNPQGLYVDQAGTIWETEHGPRGGDELNIISQGSNYGWPFVTYGTHMLSHSWPLSARQGEHDGFEPPVWTWVPSTAISNLIRVRGNLFDRWAGDLLIGSYKKTLWRVRFREGRAMYAEPIELRDKNARIRDILEDTDGNIVLLLDGGSIAVLKPATTEKRVPDGIAGSDSMRGQLLFAQCRSCHDVKDGTSHGIGPDLAGIVGRPIGRASNYNYSSKFSSLTGSWSTANLDKFLENPQHFAEGTSMMFGGIPNSSDRAQLINFLKTLK